MGSGSIGKAPPWKMNLTPFPFSKAGTGKWRQVHPAVWLVAALFALRYALE